MRQSQGTERELPAQSYYPSLPLVPSVAMTSSAPKSPWCSVNDMLIQNRCWLCEETFPRGLTKKVFQVSHLTDYCYARREAEAASQPLAAITSKHLSGCYESYKLLVSADDSDNLDRLQGELKAVDVEVWMSGLICAQSAACAADMKLILPFETVDPNAKAEVSYVTSVQGGAQAINGRLQQMHANKQDCPPGCGCDDPWRFLS